MEKPDQKLVEMVSKLIQNNILQPSNSNQVVPLSSFNNSNQGVPLSSFNNVPMSSPQILRNGTLSIPPQTNVKLQNTGSNMMYLSVFYFIFNIFIIFLIYLFYF